MQAQDDPDSLHVLDGRWVGLCKIMPPDSACLAFVFLVVLKIFDNWICFMNFFLKNASVLLFPLHLPCSRARVSAALFLVVQGRT